MTEENKPQNQEPTIEELKKSLEECEKFKSEYLAGWQRARADFLNYKKEEMEKIEEIITYTNAGLLLKALSILDNFSLAEKVLSAEAKKDNNVCGLLQIKIQFEELLKSQGIKEIESLGKKFDPSFHEVIGEVEKCNIEAGTIIEETQKGYLLNDKVLRPAKVKIAK